MFSLPDDVDRKPLFTVTDELLQKHIYILYTELEPRNIADVMFQESHISISDHDIVTDFQQKRKRLNSLLDILKRNRLYAEFVCTLESLNYAVVLNTLKEDRHFICESSKYTHFLSFSLFIFNLILGGFFGFILAEIAICIQHNFTLLQMELPDTDYSVPLLEHILDPSNISDIEVCGGSIRKKSKLLKIILMKGNHACTELFHVLKSVLKREDLIQLMIKKSADITRRGNA